MRTLIGPRKLPKLVNEHPRRWGYRRLSRYEKKRIESFFAYSGNDPFWFDGGKEGDVSMPVFVGRGDGQKTHFFLPDYYVFPSSLVLYVDGIVEPHWTLNQNSGLLTLEAAPRSGAKSTAKYRCKFKCTIVEKRNGTIEIREVGSYPRRNSKHGGDAVAARRLIADFLNFQPKMGVERESSLYWLLYETQVPKEIELCRFYLEKLLEPVIDQPPTHDSRTARYIKTIADSGLTSECPVTPLKRDLERLIEIALQDRKLQRLHRCQWCKKIFVGEHANSKVCSPECGIDRDRHKQRLRQQRYIQNKKVRELDDNRIKTQKRQQALFKHFMQKAAGSTTEQMEVKKVIRRVPRDWKTVKQWLRQQKHGQTSESIWTSLSTPIRRVLTEVLIEVFDETRL